MRDDVAMAKLMETTRQPVDFLRLRAFRGVEKHGVWIRRANHARGKRPQPSENREQESEEWTSALAEGQRMENSGGEGERSEAL